MFKTTNSDFSGSVHRHYSKARSLASMHRML